MSRALAANRFGLGARPGDLDRIDDPRTWLIRQLGTEVPEPLRGLPTGAQMVGESLAIRGEGKAARKAFEARARTLFAREVEARWTVWATTDQPFRERWIRLLTNHFTVSALKKPVTPLWGAFEREAIRPHAFGPFEDLLLAVVRHPAMLVYLDNVRSIGPDSPAGKRRARGLNENLAREILELHTLGVSGGYQQADVEALARLITGWSLPFRPGDTSFAFRPRAHEPGPKTLLGRTYPEGEAGGVAALRAVARHPATRAHLCRKLAVHLLGDDPPPRAIRALAGAWQASDGHLGRVAEAAVALHDAWAQPGRKVKSPEEVVISAARAMGQTDGSRLAAMAVALGQPTGQATSPAGWPDSDAAWLGPEGMLSRLDLANQLALRSYRSVPSVPALATSILGDSLGQRTLAALRSASPRRGLALLLVSPEFQRR